LNKAKGLSMRRTTGILAEHFGLKITPGGLAQLVQRVGRKVQPEYDRMAVELRHSAVVHADETSWWVGGSGSWLWTFTTPDRTIYRVEKSRGKDVVFDTLGAHFAGVLTSDCLASYENLPYVMHKCYAHHLKAIAAARDRKPEDQRSYFHELTALLHAAMMLDRMRGDLSPPEFLRIRQNLDQQADALILPSRTDPDEERVANRLRKRRQWLFTFLDHPGVEATNNRAERALRVREPRHAAVQPVEHQRHENRDRRLLEAPAHRLHDGVEPGKQRSRGEQVGQQVDAAPAQVQVVALIQFVHGFRASPKWWWWRTLYHRCSP